MQRRQRQAAKRSGRGATHTRMPPRRAPAPAPCSGTAACACCGPRCRPQCRWSRGPAGGRSMCRGSGGGRGAVSSRGRRAISARLLPCLAQHAAAARCRPAAHLSQLVLRVGCQIDQLVLLGSKVLQVGLRACVCAGTREMGRALQHAWLGSGGSDAQHARAWHPRVPRACCWQATAPRCMQPSRGQHGRRTCSVMVAFQLAYPLTWRSMHSRILPCSGGGGGRRPLRVAPHSARAAAFHTAPPPADLSNSHS